MPQGVLNKQRLIRVTVVAVLLLWTATAVLVGPAHSRNSAMTEPTQNQPKANAPAAQAPQPKAQAKPQDKPKEDESIVQLGGELVTVPFTATDKRNRYITNLKETDIRVLEDGKPQEIFSLIRETDLPLTMALLIDTSGSQELTLPDQRHAAIKFFQSVMRPNKDVAAVVSFSGESDLVQRMTGNQQRLIEALDSIQVSLPSVVASGGTPPINSGSRSGSTAILDAVYVTVDELLAREAGRRVVILLTDGHENSSRTKMKEAIERAWRSEVQIYAIGVPGAARSGGYVEYFSVDKGTLRKLCEDTGGRAFFPERDEDLNSAFRQIEEDLRQQYILSYAPSNAVHDGSFRSIKVEVPTQKDLQVRHRRGYFAPKDVQTK